MNLVSRIFSKLQKSALYNFDKTVDRHDNFQLCWLQTWKIRKKERKKLSYKICLYIIIITLPLIRCWGPQSTSVTGSVVSWQFSILLLSHLRTHRRVRARLLCVLEILRVKWTGTTTELHFETHLQLWPDTTLLSPIPYFWRTWKKKMMMD